MRQRRHCIASLSCWRHNCAMKSSYRLSRRVSVTSFFACRRVDDSVAVMSALHAIASPSRRPRIASALSSASPSRWRHLTTATASHRRRVGYASPSHQRRHRVVVVSASPPRSRHVGFASLSRRPEERCASDLYCFVLACLGSVKSSSCTCHARAPVDVGKN